MKTKDFAEKHGFNVELVSVSHNPSMPDSSEKMINWLAMLFIAQGTHSGIKKKVFQVYFSTGLGWVENRITKKRVYDVTWSPQHQDFIVSRLGKKYTEKQLGESFISRYRIAKPTVEDILDCLRSDFQSLESEMCFDDWALSLGYSSDSIRAKNTYDTMMKQRSDFIKTFGGNIYKELLNTEE